MKYKELPAFETNAFQVGDRIAVYEHHGRYEETVKKIVDHALVYMEGSAAHFKQCRKLEEVKPREFYVQPLYLVEMKPHPQCGFNFIKVREVLED